VEDWLAALHMVDSESRAVCMGLLKRNPELLWRDAQRTAGVVAALVEHTRQRNLMRPYTWQDSHVLALVDRYGLAPCSPFHLPHRHVLSALPPGSAMLKPDAVLHAGTRPRA
jgi:hypothetical protein